MIKKYKEIFKVTINANKASPTPPIGPMFGQRGINIMDFSKEFNNNTKEFKEEIPIPVQITLNKNRSILIDIKKPKINYFIKKICNISKGSGQAKRNIISNIKIQYIYEIIKILNKNNQLTDKEMYNECKNMIASINSMGIKIIQ